MSRGEWAEMHGPGETRLMKLPRVPVIRGQWSHHIRRIKLGDTAKILGKMVEISHKIQCLNMLQEKYQTIVKLCSDLKIF